MKFTKFGIKLFCFFLLASLIPLGVVSAIVYKYTHDRIKDEVLKQLESAAYNFNGQLNLLLAKRTYSVVDFSSDGFIRDCVEQMSSKAFEALMTPEYFQIRDNLNSHLIKNKKILDPNIIEIEILNNEGKVIASTSHEQIGKIKTHEDYFRIPFLSSEAKKTFFSGDLRSSGAHKELELVFSTILTDKTMHNPMGVIVTEVNGNELNEILDIYKKYYTDREGLTGSYGELYIVNNDKLMIANSINSGDISFKQKVDTKVVQEVMATGEGFSGVYENYKGIQVLGTVLFVPEANWVIVAEKNIKEAFLPLTEIKYIFIISGFGVISLVFIFAFVISGNVSAIIRKLIEGTRRVANGDLEHPIVIGKRKDEIKELGESFNFMMKELGKSTMANKQLFLLVKRSRDEWQKTFDAITDIITIHDKDFRILRANKAFFEKFNVDRKQLSDRKCCEIFCGNDKLWHNYPIGRSIRSLQPEYEEVHNPKMGGVFLISAYPLFDEQGELYGIVHQAKDITFQKKVEMQLVEKAKELKMANKELEDFVYIVSHDLKEPLFAIGGYTSRLLNTHKDVIDDKGKFFINRTKVNIEKMSQKIQEIMEVLKVGRVTYNYKNNDSGIIVREVVNVLESKIKKNKINVSIQDDLPIIPCDEKRIRDILSNLITNAIKFMGNDDQRQIKIGCDTDGDSHKFYVEDTGIGIREEYQEQIFKLFKRLNDIEAEGTGVGLAIVKKIVEQHKGRIWIESPVKDGRGSRFCFTIPIAGKTLDYQGTQGDV
jgi:PAS domain S-box-containing protein